MMSSYKCQEKGALKSHDCVLIYKSETEGGESHMPGSSLIGLTTKMLKVKRLEEINTCYSSNGLEKMAFLMEEVEKVKCFLEEKASEEHPRSGKNEAKEKVWSNPGLKEKTLVKDERTSALTERSTQKNQLSSEKEKIDKLNKKNSEKTNASVAQRSFAMCHSERQDKALDSVLRNSREPRESIDGKGTSCTESLKRKENNSVGDEKQATVDKNDCPALKGESNGLHSKEDTRRLEDEEEGRSPTAGAPVLDKRSSKKQHVDKTNGDQSHERCINSAKMVSAPGVLGNPATGCTLQHAEQTESIGSSKRRVTEECFVKEDSKKSRIDLVGAGEENTFKGTQEASQAQRSLQGQPPESVGMKPSREQDLVAPLDDIPAPAAPFDHRIVTAKQAAVNSLYTVSKTEILGGGRFGQVHKCEEKATGLKLAAKIIKTRGPRDKEEVKNEISVMNQLDHVNLIQLYDAFESKNDIILVMEYVEGGELFDRIIDENYNLTEYDTILFIRQICEGIRHMHQMYILHLDLKPENILCVNRDAKQIKIIDFGLARRYKPREKLKVNFGTPEFLAPEVVNYDFVSFPTDMWSVGVIAYMLLSGLSPFLGDNDAETLNNILACRWDLEDEEFQDISEEAREFISKLLIKEKSWRISASEALKHPWLSDHKLHSRLKAQKKNRSSDAQNLVTK
ncbi:myosin light chain kinase family member 4, transcript variant X1 [Ictidomys tridecemlineatus]|uniref:myosin light chain kinase family member 4 isoform X2 n=1 Tax=Ictidomys tridecemlineatus TaxID=43179 RepID=UPI0006835AC3|nr:myosin light chain kinase family member 4 isoform X2 [Ictidomys tridecemlineatus]KAG3288797.1 myosin light chain kinase family member 4, transcript variant X1 [Ictidomys tridecemlineatus]